ncbi:hypothetical protein HD554DRAFT_1804420 [Boletus coccyginus]|nr:hypothetical protein HD554DRAFT_1804420 [Boletus coccyginus]
MQFATPGLVHHRLCSSVSLAERIRSGRSIHSAQTRPSPSLREDRTDTCQRLIERERKTDWMYVGYCRRVLSTLRISRSMHGLTVHESPGGAFDFWGLVTGEILTTEGKPVPDIYYRYDNYSQTVE